MKLPEGYVHPVDSLARQEAASMHIHMKLPEELIDLEYKLNRRILPDGFPVYNSSDIKKMIYEAIVRDCAEVCLWEYDSDPDTIERHIFERCHSAILARYGLESKP